MKPIGGGQYQFSSQVNSVTGGFFPLDPTAHGFPLYTAAPAGPGTPPQMVRDRADALQPVALLVTARPGSAPAVNCRGDQYLFPPSLIPPDTTGVCPGGMNCNGKWYVGQQGWFHDSWFTDEARYLFTVHGRVQRCSSTATTTCSSSSTACSSSTSAASTSACRGESTSRARPARRPSPKAARWTWPARPSCPARPARIPYTGVAFNLTTGNDGNGHMNCTNATCDCRTRTVNLGLADGSDLRDRGVRRGSPPDRVELPADAVRVPDAEVELHAPLRRRPRRPAPRSATAATRPPPRRRIRSVPG